MKSAEIISDMLRLMSKIREFEKQNVQVQINVQLPKNVHQLDFRKRSI